ncbi:MAG: hypothetical protein NC420_12030 [Eubacterium sp.]|nr:hypothetical protein [Eubacterium sp.]MCM1212987.1 hypothetical protein [Lachnospiraceae bacterium]MCM1305190.1 hypothetical protein [Butyrivibrio sp.]MCM1344677.1 hypothetical protein [Muribaculaceae bacterium]MCM1239920.1 hypothetical protein [Lachnospiraceae bacterium]
MALTNEDLMAISNLMDQKIHPINDRLDRIEIRLDKLESDVSALKVGQAELSRHLTEIDKKVSYTYQLALDAWGTSTENRTWLETGNLGLKA